MKSVWEHQVNDSAQNAEIAQTAMTEDRTMQRRLFFFCAKAWYGRHLLHFHCKNLWMLPLNNGLHCVSFVPFRLGSKLEPLCTLKRGNRPTAVRWMVYRITLPWPFSFPLAACSLFSNSYGFPVGKHCIKFLWCHAAYVAAMVRLPRPQDNGMVTNGKACL